ncbi:MAG: hypothetical protein Pg6C_03800 [Treponemataceae bacterium]|nr:MAG: hypothetical protein Pg6C_03800 [Treponemataceae bacterium]
MKNLIEQFFENKHLYEKTRQLFDPDQDIATTDDVSCALMYIAQTLQIIANSISTEKLQCTLDHFLPGTRLKETEVLDINLLCKNVTVINQRITEFLQKNPDKFIDGIDQIIAIVQRSVNTVNEVIQNENTQSLIRFIEVFKTILGVFNHILNIVDAHNIQLNKNYKSIILYS